MLGLSSSGSTPGRGRDHLGNISMPSSTKPPPLLMLSRDTGGAPEAITSITISAGVIPFPRDRVSTLVPTSPGGAASGIITSYPSPRLNRKTLFPAFPYKVSLPAPPAITSFPSPPDIRSLPALPSTISSPNPESIISLPAEP